jgi:AraC family transcriptional regulator
MSAVTKTIWLIESHFLQPITLDLMAAHAGVSRSHLSRIFPLATGFSISAYLHGRRLSEAAKVLVAGAPDILSVAIEAGYGSHEAFTRAFREQFGLTPEEARRNGTLATIELVEPLDMHLETRTSIAAPHIEDRGSLRLAGLMERHDMARASTLPIHWQKFQQYLGHIPGMIGRSAYGVVGEMGPDSHDFEYLTAVEVTESAELPAGFTTVVLPARRYARFSHKGHISSIRSTIAAIFEDWFPASRREPLHESFSFVEYYGPRFDPVTGLGDVEIWVALKP